MQIKICDVPVPVYDASGQPVPSNSAGLKNTSPLLYRWEIYRGSVVHTAYVGLASKGQSRPTATYPKVTKDLRASRGSRKLCADPVTPFFPRSPWGFRWIHHQLEGATQRILNEGDPYKESAALFLLPVNISDQLRVSEKAAIDALLALHGPAVVANGKRSMAHHARENLDPVWTCTATSASPK